MQDILAVFSASLLATCNLFLPESVGWFSAGRKLKRVSPTNKSNLQLPFMTQGQSLHYCASVANSVTAPVLLLSLQTLMHQEFTCRETMSCLYLPAAAEAISEERASGSQRELNFVCVSACVYACVCLCSVGTDKQLFNVRPVFISSHRGARKPLTSQRVSCGH